MICAVLESLIARRTFHNLNSKKIVILRLN